MYSYDFTWTHAISTPVIFDFKSIFWAFTYLCIVPHPYHRPENVRYSWEKLLRRLKNSHLRFCPRKSLKFDYTFQNSGVNRSYWYHFSSFWILYRFSLYFLKTLIDVEFRKNPGIEPSHTKMTNSHSMIKFDPCWSLVENSPAARFTADINEWLYH